MPCEHYKDSLVEAAAAGAKPQGELSAHLAACSSCRAAFAEEQSLFASIDAGLHATANAEVPPSLLPRVRAALVAVAHPRRWLQPLVFASSTVVLAFIVFLIARPHHAAPEEVARQGPVVAPTPMTPATNVNPGKIPAAPTETASSGANPPHAVRNSTFFHPVASSNPEVLVPPDEGEAFAGFVAALNEQGDFAAALVAKAPEKNNVPVSVDPLQIAEIEIKPLGGTDPQTSGGAGETR